jgi:hypothetical protein
VTKRAGYFSYLLRLWQTSDGEALSWRVSLEEPGTQRRWGFATLDQLVSFLRCQMSTYPDEPEGGLEAFKEEHDEDQK